MLMGASAITATFFSKSNNKKIASGVLIGDYDKNALHGQYAGHSILRQSLFAFM
jgi:hypothetical protein